MATLELYFDFLSPYTYLASTQVEAIASRTTAKVEFTPFQILELMKRVGNRPTTLESANKHRYATADLQRWAERYGVPLNPHPRLRTFDYDLLLRGAVAADEAGMASDYVRGVLRAIWGEPRDLDNLETFVSLLDELGLSGARIVERASEAEVAERLAKNTERAAERGAFGSPTWYVGDQMFFGNDRLDFVEHALATA
ncbi:2-hydroxychromene-2-carboxylate isomerase [Phenylobacterium sp.]|uniref:2-hydroxychromene-2-carboxylate isomerase n=1 Tax=Phenylobacterium sp. TaxID=1871053 RepID=UPI0035AEDAD1